MITKMIHLGGFMTRQFLDERSGKKFRSQVRRRAQRMADDDGSSTEIRGNDDALLDYCMGPTEYRGLLFSYVPELDDPRG